MNYHVVTSLRLPGLLGLCWLQSAAFMPYLMAAKVYYINQPERTAAVTGQGAVVAVNPDGTGQTTVHTAPVATDMRGIATDPVTKRLYVAYCELDAAGTATQVSLRSMSMTGGAWTTIQTYPNGPVGSSFNPISDVEYDSAGQWLYFSTTASSALRKIKLDGTQESIVLTNPGPDSGPYFFGLDLVNQQAYWGVVTGANETFKPYFRGSLTTGIRDTNFTLNTVSRTRDIAVDTTVPGVRLYWCDRQEGNLYTRMANDMTAPIVATRPRRTFNAPHGLALDLEAGKAYIADTGKRGSATEASSHNVARVNLDGTGPVEILAAPDAVAEPWDLALDLTSVSYADWKTRFFAQVDVASGQPDSDPDRDGWNNITEYGFFTNPAKANASLVPIIQARGEGIQYPRRRSSTSLAWRVEVSNDLMTWQWNGDGSGVTWTTHQVGDAYGDDGYWDQVSLGAVPTAFTARKKVFFRVRLMPLP
jgi:DNA-binding beta-propeller fold protein YncE